MRRTVFYGAACTAMLVTAAQAQIIYDNTQPPQAGDNNFLITDPALGCGGLDASAVQTADGNTLYGFGAQNTAGNRMADQFELCTPASVSKIRFYTYQTGETTVTINASNLFIWQDGASSCALAVYDSTVTPPTAQNFGLTNTYRVLDTGLADCARRIQYVDYVFDPPLALAAGVYWLDVDFAGSGASGPWMPPLANLAGAGASGDCWQWTGGYAPGLDGTFQMAMPFIVEGTGGACSPGESVPPANDDMANAAILTCQFGGQLYDLSAATGDGPGASCDGGGGSCFGDITGVAPGSPPDGSVDVNDLLAVLGQWGGPGTADITGVGGPPAPPDGIVDVNDLLGVLGAWGPCPPGPVVASANVWYSYTAVATESIRITASDGSGIAVYDGTGAEIACDATGSADAMVMSGASYLIEVFAANGSGTEPAQLVINATPSSNDDCTSPDPISDGLWPFSTIGATGSGPDHPPPACQYLGITVDDIWFIYTAAAEGILTVSTCEDTGGSADYDTDLVVYANTDCDNLELLGCSDDTPDYPCGQAAPWHSHVEVPVTSGQQILIRVGGWQTPGADQGTGELFVQLAPGPINGLCPGASPLDIGTVVSADTTGVAFDPQATLCDTIVPDTGGYWYSVIGDGNTLTATTCILGTAYDTIISVYCGDCPELFCVGANDADGLCFVNFVGESTFSWCSAVGQEYLVYVHGFSGAQGVFDLQVTSDGSPCVDPPVCGIIPCTFECPAGALQEGEPCLVDDAVDDFNGGCNSTPNVFSTNLAINGAAVCGTSSTYATAAGNSRDTDWYFVTHTGGDLTVTVNSEFTALFGIVSDVDTCQAAAFVANNFTAGNCDQQSVTATALPAGNYAVWVGPDVFTGWTCADGLNNYWVTVTSP